MHDHSIYVIFSILYPLSNSFCVPPTSFKTMISSLIIVFGVCLYLSVWSVSISPSPPPPPPPRDSPPRPPPPPAPAHTPPGAPPTRPQAERGRGIGILIPQCPWNEQHILQPWSKSLPLLKAHSTTQNQHPGHQGLWSAFCVQTIASTPWKLALLCSWVSFFPFDRNSL